MAPQTRRSFQKVGQLPVVHTETVRDENIPFPHATQASTKGKLRSAHQGIAESVQQPRSGQQSE